MPIKECLKEIYFNGETFGSIKEKILEAFETLDHINQLLEFIFVNIRDFCESVKKFFFENFDFITFKKEDGFRTFVSLEEQEPVYRRILEKFLDSWIVLLRIRTEVDMVLECFRELRGHRKTTTTYNIPSSHEQIFFYVVLNFPHIKKLLQYLHHELEHTDLPSDQTFTLCKMIFLKLKEIILLRSTTYFETINCRLCKLTLRKSQSTPDSQPIPIQTDSSVTVSNEEPKKKKKKKKKRKSTQQPSPEESLPNSKPSAQDPSQNSQNSQPQIPQPPQRKGSFESLLLEFERKLEHDRETCCSQKVNLNISPEWIDSLKKRIK